MAKNEDPRARILAAADQLFGARGFDAVSARDVAAEAGVAKAAVFYYFDGKDGLFAAVLERYYTLHRAALAAALDGEGDLRLRLHGIIDAYLDFITTHQRYPRMVQRMVADEGGDLTIVRQNLAGLYGEVERALADVTPRTGPLAARQFFVTLSGAVINYFTYGPALAEMWGSDPLSPEAVAERRGHLHWLVDCLLDRLTAEAG